MIRRTRSNLRRMRDGQHLHFFRQPREPRADGIRNRSADAGIDFVEKVLTLARAELKV